MKAIALGLSFLLAVPPTSASALDSTEPAASGTVEWSGNTLVLPGVLSLTVEGGFAFMEPTYIYRYRTATDTVTVEYPADGDGMIVFGINGAKIDVPVTDLDAEVPMSTAAIEQLTATFDWTAFQEALQVFSSAVNQQLSALTTKTTAAVATQGIGSCITCAAALIGVGVALALLVSACGAAGPGTMALCIIAFFRLHGVQLAAIGSCISCAEYLKE